MIRWFETLNLNPTERRAAIFGACLVGLLLNYWLIWPYFREYVDFQRDWTKLEGQKAIYFKEVSKKASYEKLLRALEGSGAQVMPEEQANNVQSSIQSAAATNLVNILRITPQLASLRLAAAKDTNFFDEQVVIVDLSAKEEGLVQFLHALGSSDSMIRVRDMGRLKLDGSQQSLSASVTFVASFQKKPKPIEVTVKASNTPPAVVSKPMKSGSSSGKTNGGSSRITVTNLSTKTPPLKK